MFDIEKLKFDDKGLIPAIVVDDKTGDVLKQTLTYTKNQSANAGRTECRVDLEKPENYESGDLVYVFAWQAGGGITPIAKKTIIE